jgi:hypothetical protein
MSLKSCQNCVFNGLQYGTLGSATGYCVAHQRLLRAGDQTTCGRLLRKDLQSPSAEAEAAHHARRFPLDTIVRLQRAGGWEPASDHAAPTAADAHLRPSRAADPVRERVTEYGELDTTIESLARLKDLPGPRAELARHALGRSYVRRCRLRQGAWTSGLHLLWWAGSAVEADPEVGLDDLRSQETAIPLERQVELASWSLVMLRLTFIADVAHNAAGAEPAVAALQALPEAAALAAGTNLRKLLRWAKSEGRPAFERALPRARYTALAQALHQASPPLA